MDETLAERVRALVDLADQAASMSLSCDIDGNKAGGWVSTTQLRALLDTPAPADPVAECMLAAEKGLRNLGAVNTVVWFCGETNEGAA